MTADIKTPHLTKSKFIAGMQCHKKLWLDCHEKSKYQEPVPGSAFHHGILIGEEAQTLFPDGILIGEAAYEHDAAIRKTKEAMERPEVPAIFEAAFEYDNIRVRVDVLERLDSGGWRILEIKSSASVKDHHIDDAGIQYYVLNGCGIEVRSVEIGYADKSYVRKAGEVDWCAYFARDEIIKSVLSRQPEIERNLLLQKEVLLNSSPPDVQPNKHRCKKPYTCDYWDRCTKDKPLDWVQRLHSFNWKKVVALELQGIVSVSDLPIDHKLTEIQLKERNTFVTGEAFISDDLGKALKGFGPPAYYLDFEYARPAFPYYQGTSPTELIAFQWSCHFINSKEDLLKLTVSDCLELDANTRPNYHHEYLADGSVDPSEECAEKLLEILGQDEHPILVHYVTAEKGAIKSLANRVPERREELLNLIPRFKDLCPIVRSYTSLPEYFSKPLALDGGNYSIKTTAHAFDAEFDHANHSGT